MIHGTVKLEDGTPVISAQVSIRTHYSGGHGNSYTDNNGEFEYNVNAHELLNVGVTNQEWAAPGIFAYDVGDGSEDKKMDIVLSKGIRIYGKVFMPDGKPAKGFSLFFEEKDPNTPASYKETAVRRVIGEYRSDTVTRQTYDSKRDGTGEYEYYLPAVPRQYRFFADKNPDEEDSRKLSYYVNDFQLQGDEKEVRVDFHLSEDGR